jgi:ABC-type sugar transport system ATPase subunit
VNRAYQPKGTKALSSVELRGITKSFASAKGAVTPVLHGVDIAAEAGEFLVLLGPSGCGKSTSLRILAGLESADGGDVLIDGRRVNDVPAAQRRIAMVFQNYALYPHLTVLENIVFGLRVRKVKRDERDRRAREAAELLGLSDHLGRRPAELSGGQRQRVALGRALVSGTKIILMDEPLSNLDAKLRAQMRVELRALQRELGLTVIYVTHDQVEAMTMADRVVVMREGRVEQDATPVDLYREPATVNVAAFIGSPPMNLVPARVVGEGLRLDVDGQPVVPVAVEERAVAEVQLGVRPEDLRLDGTGDAHLPGRVLSTELLGAETLVSVDLGSGAHVVVRAQGLVPAEPGSDVTLGFSVADVRVFARGNGERLAVHASSPAASPARS